MALSHRAVKFARVPHFTELVRSWPATCKDIVYKDQPARNGINRIMLSIPRVANGTGMVWAWSAIRKDIVCKDQQPRNGIHHISLSILLV